MNRFAPTLLALVTALGVFSALPANAAEDVHDELQKCAAIRNAAERLFCFDSLAAGAGAGHQAQSAPRAATPPSRAANTSPAAMPRQTPPPAASRSDGEFGLELQNTREGPQSITSRYDGTFNGWTGDTEFPLENGQVWKQVESDRLALTAERPTITIRRGWFGVFYLKVEGANKQIRVKRIK